MINNFDVCYYDDMAIHFDVFAVVLRQRCVTIARLTVVYRYAYLHCEARVFDSNTRDAAR